jgi:hypothetical protein
MGRHRNFTREQEICFSERRKKCGFQGRQDGTAKE